MLKKSNISYNTIRKNKKLGEFVEEEEESGDVE